MGSCTPKVTRVGLYSRVSTEAQTTGNQKRDLARYCEARRFVVVSEHEDVGISGAVDSRPGLDALMVAARQRQFDAVVVWKFDRFARSTQHLLAALQEFQRLGIDFISYSEGIDTSSSVGKMVFTFLGAVAEFERELIRERVIAGLDRARDEGVRLGRPRVGFDAAEAVRLHRQGLGVRRIAHKLGVSPSTVHRTLTGLAV